MRILHVVNDLRTGGAERMVAELAVAQSDLGHEVTLLTLGRDMAPAVTRILNCSRVRVSSCGLSSVRNPLTGPLMVFLHARSHEIVNAHLFPAQLWVALMATGRVRFATEHSTNYRRRRFWVFRQVDRLMLRRYAALVCVSDAVQSQLLGLYPMSAAKVTTIENGIDVDRFANAEPIERSELAADLIDDAKIIVAVGRLVDVKDHQTLLEALRLLSDEYYLTIVGDGPNEGELRNSATALGVDKRVKFLGNRVDVPEILKAADLFVSASQWEGYGLALAEALASGVPVVVSAIPAHLALIDGAAAVFAPGDSHSLAAAIRSTMAARDRKTLDFQQSKGRARVRDIDHVARDYLDAYARSLRERCQHE